MPGIALARVLPAAATTAVAELSSLRTILTPFSPAGDCIIQFDALLFQEIDGFANRGLFQFQLGNDDVIQLPRMRSVVPAGVESLPVSIEIGT